MEGNWSFCLYVQLAVFQQRRVYLEKPTAQTGRSSPLRSGGSPVVCKELMSSAEFPAVRHCNVHSSVLGQQKV